MMLVCKATEGYTYTHSVEYSWHLLCLCTELWKYFMYLFFHSYYVITICSVCLYIVIISNEWSAKFTRVITKENFYALQNLPWMITKDSKLWILRWSITDQRDHDQIRSCLYVCKYLFIYLKLVDLRFLLIHWPWFTFPHRTCVICILDLDQDISLGHPCKIRIR